MSSAVSGSAASASLSMKKRSVTADANASPPACPASKKRKADDTASPASAADDTPALDDEGRLPTLPLVLRESDAGGNPPSPSAKPNTRAAAADTQKTPPKAESPAAAAARSKTSMPASLASPPVKPREEKGKAAKDKDAKLTDDDGDEADDVEEADAAVKSDKMESGGKRDKMESGGKGEGVDMEAKHSDESAKAALDFKLQTDISVIEMWKRSLTTARDGATAVHTAFDRNPSVKTARRVLEEHMNVHLFCIAQPFTGKMALCGFQVDSDGAGAAASSSGSSNALHAATEDYKTRYCAFEEATTAGVIASDAENKAKALQRALISLCFHVLPALDKLIAEAGAKKGGDKTAPKILAANVDPQTALNLLEAYSKQLELLGHCRTMKNPKRENKRQLTNNIRNCGVQGAFAALPASIKTWLKKTCGGLKAETCAKHIEHVQDWIRVLTARVNDKDGDADDDDDAAAYDDDGAAAAGADSPDADAAAVAAADGAAADDGAADGDGEALRNKATANRQRSDDGDNASGSDTDAPAGNATAPGRKAKQ